VAKAVLSAASKASALRSKADIRIWWIPTSSNLLANVGSWDEADLYSNDADALSPNLQSQLKV
jgi:hypothetical protein